MKRPTPRSILSEINTIIATWIEKGLAIDQNAHYKKTKRQNIMAVSFQQDPSLPSIIKNNVYEATYKQLLNARQYSVKLLDGALLQMMYRFENQSLASHRLAFYPAPNFLRFTEDPTLYAEPSLFTDLSERDLIAFPLRFDFDARNAKEVVHPHSHLTLGDVKHCRIPLSSALTPYWFAEFILRNFYQTPKYDLVAQLPTPRHQFESSITPRERKVIHVNVPSTA